MSRVRVMRRRHGFGAVKEFLRVMWWRHGPGGHGRQVKVIFNHGMHAGYHTGRGVPSLCDERCERLLSRTARI